MSFSTPNVGEEKPVRRSNVFLMSTIREGAAHSARRGGKNPRSQFLQLQFQKK